MNGYKVIVDKSTVPAGTSERVRAAIADETTHAVQRRQQSGVPEAGRGGRGLPEARPRGHRRRPTPRAAEIMRELYRPFTRTGAPIMVMDPASAELCKYAANAMLATRISFMNEIANVCERFGADVDKVRQAIASDKRIGPAFLFPGVGYGGSCFPKDVKAIIKFSSDKKYRFRILEAVEAVNEAQKLRLLERLDEQFGKKLKGETIAVWGLAFKPRTDDMREAPAVPIIEGLLERGRARCARSTRRRKPVAQRIFKKRITYARERLRRAQGRRRAARRHRVERVPRAGFRRR